MNRIYHNPPHLYLDNSIYIVTSRTYAKVPYFNSDEKKRMLQDKIFEAINKTNSELYAWVVLDDHYHVIFEIQKGQFLGKLVKHINGTSSRAINAIDCITGRKIWLNYWDTCIRNEEDFYTRLNYVHQNPIKHGYFQDLTGLEQYPFSSYSTLLKEKGREWIADAFRKYPIKDFTEKGED